jgi:leader peptidase (prepilin peptidase)/N-methyltransferase
MLLTAAFELPAFLLGLLIGSFLNVCISRLPYHESISKPRSHCPRCMATIRWYDNVPLLSWILLAAKCRNCKSSIPWRYPLVELAVGIWFALCTVRLTLPLAVVFHLPIRVYAMYGTPAQLMIDGLGLAILGFLLIGLLVMDWQTHTLPDAFTITGIVIGFVLICIQSLFLGPHQDEVLLHGANPLTSPGGTVDSGNVVLTGAEHLILGRLLAIVLAGCIILVIRWLYKLVRGHEGMGLGDAKLMAMLAAFLGFWPAILAMLIGVILSAVYAVTLLARRRANSTTPLPLGTFLCIGGLFAALFAPPLITWYTSLF